MVKVFEKEETYPFEELSHKEYFIHPDDREIHIKIDDVIAYNFQSETITAIDCNPPVIPAKVEFEITYEL